MTKTKTKTTKVEKVDKYVSADDFNSFKSSIVGILENISSKLNDSVEPERKVMTTGSVEKTDAGSISSAPSNETVVHNLDDEQQAIFDKYFDMEDGFIGMLKGVNFKIEVPLKLSNAQEAHKTFYKKDVRHKVLDGNDINGSLERWCRLVASNLNYKRNVRLKI